MLSEHFDVVWFAKTTRIIMHSNEMFDDPNRSQTKNTARITLSVYIYLSFRCMNFIHWSWLSVVNQNKFYLSLFEFKLFFLSFPLTIGKIGITTDTSYAQPKTDSNDDKIASELALQFYVSIYICWTPHEKCSTFFFYFDYRRPLFVTSCFFYIRR